MTKKSGYRLTSIIKAFEDFLDGTEHMFYATDVPEVFIQETTRPGEDRACYLRTARDMAEQIGKLTGTAT